MLAMHNQTHYEAISSNKTFSSPSNYTCNDADGCLEHRGGCHKNIWTVFLDGAVPLKVTDFRREPPKNILTKTTDGEIRLQRSYTLSPHCVRITALRNLQKFQTVIGAVKYHVSLYIAVYIA